MITVTRTRSLPVSEDVYQMVEKIHAESILKGTKKTMTEIANTAIKAGIGTVKV